jgi:hypothetical protein
LPTSLAQGLAEKDHFHLITLHCSCEQWEGLLCVKGWMSIERIVLQPIWIFYPAAHKHVPDMGFGDQFDALFCY